MTSSSDEAPTAIDNPSTDHASFTRVFMGILKAPVVTFAYLDEHFERLDSYALTNHVFNVVFLTFALIGASRIKIEEGGWASVTHIVFVICNGMIVWLLLALSMSVLASLEKDHMPWKKALTLTGWAFLPMIFYAPLQCYKQLLGPIIFLFGFAPLLWSAILQMQAFKVGLKLSNKKVIALALILPPLLTFAYLFWVAFAGAALIGEFMSYFQ
jgi:hypothetical protein